MSDAASSLIQYGAVGVIASLALAGIGVLFQRGMKILDREQARADRLEAQLQALNEVIRGQYTQVLSEATRAIGDAIALVRGTHRR